MMRRAWLLLLAGCHSCDEQQPAPVAVNTVPDIAVVDGEQLVGDATRYDCTDVEPEPMTGACPETHGLGDDLIVLSDELSAITADHLPASSPVWAPAGRALTKAEGVDAASLAASERIALQNAAFHLARVAKTLEPALAQRAEKLVQRLAFVPAALIDTDLEPWLGPKSAFSERHVPVIPFVHEQFFSETRVLRIVRTPSVRANFSKLVAIDPSGKPYVTNVVGSVEIRRGMDKHAAVCVVLVDPSRLRCGKLGGLRAIRSLADLPQTPFLRHDDRVAKCNSCHIDEDSVVGLKLLDGFEPDHDRKVLDELAKTN